MMKSKVLTRPSHAALYLIEHKQGIIAVTQRPRSSEEFARERHDSRLAEDRFQYYCANAFRERVFQSRHSLLFNDLDIRQQRPKGRLILFLGRNTQSTNRPAMKCISQGEYYRLVRLPGTSRRGPGNLQCRLHGFGPAVGKEDL